MDRAISVVICLVFTQFSCWDRSWCKINANWVIWARRPDVARPKTPSEPEGNITDDPSWCINEDVWYKYMCGFVYISLFFLDIKICELILYSCSRVGWKVYRLTRILSEIWSDEVYFSMLSLLQPKHFFFHCCNAYIPLIINSRDDVIIETLQSILIYTWFYICFCL